MNGAGDADVRLRGLQDADVPAFFAHQEERYPADLIAFPSRPRADFEAHWKKLAADPVHLLRSVLCDGRVAGYVASFVREGDPRREVSYVLGREFWGRGVATRALALFLKDEKTRPLCGRVLKWNKASLRVLLKCGFSIESEGTFKTKAGRVEEEYVLVLAAGPGA